MIFTMNKILIITIAALFNFGDCISQDKIIKTNNEFVHGKIILFQNGKFTLLLPDKSELSFPKDGIKEIQFDTSKCAALSIQFKSNKEEDMDPDCATKNLGNCVFENKTGFSLTLMIHKEGDDERKRRHEISNSEDPVKFYGLESGSYIWEVTSPSFQSSGGLYIPKCKTATTVTIK